MNGYTSDLKTYGLRAIDVQQAFSLYIDPMLSEDVEKYNLQNKNKLLRQFIAFRVISFVFEALDKCREDKVKAIFLLPANSSLLSSSFSKNNVFIYNFFRKISDVLSLNVLVVDSIKSFIGFFNSDKGEGKELRAKATVHMFKQKLPNLMKLNAILEKYKIHKLQGDIAQNFKVKLGLYIT